MRLVNYLNEKSVAKFSDFDIAMEFMEKNCQPFIDYWTKRLNPDDFLYRGVPGVPDIFLKKVRKNRKPMNTEEEIQKIADDNFERRFGIRARSETVFCSSKIKQAKDYGQPRIIFPVGKYEVIWSPDIEDMYLSMSSDIEEFRDQLNSYIKGRLSDAIFSGNEIMLHCESYIGFDSVIYEQRLIDYFKQRR